jgi:hypothetical protein
MSNALDVFDQLQYMHRKQEGGIMTWGPFAIKDTGVSEEHTALHESCSIREIRQINFSATYPVQQWEEN